MVLYHDVLSIMEKESRASVLVSGVGRNLPKPFFGGHICLSCPVTATVKRIHQLWPNNMMTSFQP